MRVEYLTKGVDVFQSDVIKAKTAEERSGQTRSFVRTVKAAAPRKYTPEEKVRITVKAVFVDSHCFGLLPATRALISPA